MLLNFCKSKNFIMGKLFECIEVLWIVISVVVVGLDMSVIVLIIMIGYLVCNLKVLKVL